MVMDRSSSESQSKDRSDDSASMVSGLSGATLNEDRGERDRGGGKGSVLKNMFQKKGKGDDGKDGLKPGDGNV